MRYRSILLFGAPGSGKGTQGKIIGSIPGFHHSSTGDIFRSLDLQSPMGRKFWEFAGRGELVPDEFTISLWKQYIKGMEMVNQFHPETEFLVLDGIPRNLGQARLLEDTLDVILILYLRADLNKMVERLKRRALKENRIDDASDSVIKRRLEVYERETPAGAGLLSAGKDPPHRRHAFTDSSAERNCEAAGANEGTVGHLPRRFPSAETLRVSGGSFPPPEMQPVCANKSPSENLE